MPQVYHATPRKQFLRQVPRTCVVCNRQHGGTVKVELDHIDENIHNNEFSNFQWLCQEHHMIKHGRIAWNALNYDGVESSMHTETIRQILAKNNPHSREALETCDAKYIRRAVSKTIGAPCRDAARTEVIVREQRGFVTIEVRGTRIEIPCGETVRII